MPQRKARLTEGYHVRTCRDASARATIPSRNTTAGSRTVDDEDGHDGEPQVGAGAVLVALLIWFR
jgi:hypothetical protein